MVNGVSAMTLSIKVSDLAPGAAKTISPFSIYPDLVRNLSSYPRQFSVLLWPANDWILLLERREEHRSDLRHLGVHPLHPQLVRGDGGRPLQDDPVPPVHRAGTPGLRGAG